MLVKTFACAVSGIQARIIQVEVSIGQGIGYNLVGLPDVAVKESQQRIYAAMQSINEKWPGKKLVINMSPADIRKEGTSFDLPLAIGILGANGRVSDALFAHTIFMGELSLDGALNPVKGVLSMALIAREAGFKSLIIPEQNTNEAAVVDGINVYGANTISKVVEWIKNPDLFSPKRIDIRQVFYQKMNHLSIDFSDVKGQEKVKRGMEVAAAGGHNILLVGSPGAGKTMLARRLPGILPSLSLEESLETTKIHSVAGDLDHKEGLVVKRPFRSPHHTISDVALVGGGSFPMPGEISLAHNGVLFLDELPEFKRNALEVMRQPLEDRSICISRARYSVEYPCSFMMVASMNPCMCGYYNHPDKECICQNGQVKKYLSKISGPLLDRIDLHVEVVPVSFDEISALPAAESSTAIRERVVLARQRQSDRFKKLEGFHTNSQMTPKMLRKYVHISKEGLGIIRIAMDKLGLSARAYDRIVKVSRTIADLQNSDNILVEHVAEAVNYRTLDRDMWGS